MKSGFRVKLMAIVAVAGVAFLVLAGTSAYIAKQVTAQLELVERVHLPRLELGPRLQAKFEALQRTLQDAVAAQDPDALTNAGVIERELLAELQGAKTLVDAAAVTRAERAIESYYGQAIDVARRMIRGETGEALPDAVRALQETHALASIRLAEATRVERQELSQALRHAIDLQTRGDHGRALIALACLLVVLLLSALLISSVLRTVTGLLLGFSRIGRGDFTHPIPVLSQDELGQLARHANDMSESLAELGATRDRADWTQRQHVALFHELRGELTPADVANRAASVLAHAIDAVAAALYRVEADGSLRLLGHHAASPSEPGATAQSFARGEGLLAQAALGQELRVVSEVPVGYLRIRSGLLEGEPRCLALVPLVRSGTTVGVLEIASLKVWQPVWGDLLQSISAPLASALEVATSRAETSALLVETQAQAARLLAQEDELRAANEELQIQQEELRKTNHELSLHSDQLRAQRNALESKNREVEEASAALKRKADELATMSTYKSQFLANMSHELRTPLNSMLLLSGLLAENESGNLTAKQVEYCQTVYGAGRDLLALIDQVLDLAKVEAGRQELKVERVDVREVTARAERLFGAVARDRGVEFEIVLEESAPKTIATDPRRLDQIITNLLGNAFKFTAKGGVRLRVFTPPPEMLACTRLTPGAYWGLSVSDTGIGIAPRDHDRVFVPFEQVEGGSDRRFGGTGLGLAIARELAVRLGGELLLESLVGEGSTFTCLLPNRSGSQVLSPVNDQDLSRHAVDDRPMRDSGRVPVRPPGAPERSAPRLLIIEDERAFATAFADIIRAQGVEVSVASDGQSGLRMAREERPDGIILDVNLPDIDGWTVLQRLHEIPETSSIPVHFVSGIEAGDRGLSLGAIGYLTKPATRKDLIHVVEALVPRLKDRPCRLLIVEDDADIVQSLTRQLQGEAVEVRKVGSAHEALQVLRQGRIDCMVLDLGLPDMDGLDFLVSLGGASRVELPPVVVYTGRALIKAEAQRLEAYTEAIVLKDGAGAERLMDEVRMFVRRLKDGLPLRKARPAEPLSASVVLDRRCALLVDDDMRTVYALSALLRAKGMNILVAENGREALEMLARHREIEIVLMDIMMPEMDGYEAMRRIRKEPRWLSLPVIALTAKAMKGDRELCLNAGATDYLSKPIEPKALYATLHKNLPAAAAVADAL